MTTFLPTDPVRVLLGRTPIVERASHTLREIADTLTVEGFGLLVVRGHAGRLSVISERDIVIAIAEGADPDETRATEYVTDDVVTVGPETTIRDAARRMIDNDIRHLVVVDPVDDPLGVVSMRDLVRVLIGDGLAASAG